MTLPSLLTALLLAQAGEAPTAISPGPEEHGARSWTLGRAKLGVYGGAFSGVKVRPDSGVLALVEGQATPVFRIGSWKLDFPLRFHHRQTFGASLSETYGSAFAGVEERVARALRLGVFAGLSGAWRPGWPDLYHPRVDNPFVLTPTDRYSFLAWHAGAGLRLDPLARNHLRLKYQYVHYGYVRDPAFDPTRPMHLTPRNNGQHRVEAAWRVLGDGYSAAARFEYVHRQDEVYLARDAVSGSTRLTPADPIYTTPYQRLDRMEPSVEVSARRLGERLDVSLLYGYQIQNDPYQGYYSYSGHHPRLVVAYGFTDRLSVRAKGEAWLREYGPNSKAAGIPPDPTTPGLLKDGTRLYDRRVAAEAAAAYALTRRLDATLTGRWVRRTTNYPDYVPGWYPSATALYDIRWNYVNTLVLAGVELRL